MTREQRRSAIVGGTALIGLAAISIGVRLWPAGKAAARNSMLRNATAYVGRGEYARAEALIRRAIWIDPSNAGIHYRLAWLLYHQGRPREAIPECEETLRLQPTYLYAARLETDCCVYLATASEPCPSVDLSCSASHAIPMREPCSDGHSPTKGTCPRPNVNSSEPSR